AHWTAALPGAVEPVAAAPASVLSAMSIGGLWLALFRGPWRLFGLGPILAALWLWSGPAERPALLVSSDARLVGRLGPEGRALDQPRASGFIAERWMERDGDLAEQAVAATRPGLEGSRKVVYAPFENGWTVVVLRRPDDAVFDQECRPKRLVISDFRLRRDGACKVIDGGDLRRLGALAIDQAGDELRITPSTASRNRLWSPKH
ncbi:MAG: ComEC family competence protein, partial [Pseudomonadota bacterium]